MAERAPTPRQAASRAAAASAGTAGKKGAAGATSAPGGAASTAGGRASTRKTTAGTTAAAGSARATGADHAAVAETVVAQKSAPTSAGRGRSSGGRKVAQAEPRQTQTQAAPRPGAAVTTNDPAPPIAALSAAEGATMAKTADTKTAATKSTGAEARVTKVAPRTTRSAAETEKIRAALSARLDEVKDEYEATISEITELQRDRLTDSAGDDQADTGTKTFEREQEISLANTILERVTQVERALERLGEGNYGWCERCGNPIPVERLAAFPSATLCVTCKQLEERR